MIKAPVLFMYWWLKFLKLWIMSYSFTTDEHFQLAVYLSHLFQKCSLFMKLGSEYRDMQYSKYSVRH